MPADFWSRLWLLAMAYPGLALIALLIMCCLGTLVALALLSADKPEIPLQQWEDDEEQHRAISKRMPLL